MVRIFRAAALCLALVMAGPAQAEVDFLTDLLMSESREESVAKAEHPKVVAEFGGVYEDPALKSYVQSIVDYLGQVSDRPDIKYRVTILNSPIVNAFALPAGYLYVTRGLLALADNEAELAGVLAHEIGHVTARHTAQRFSRSLLAQGVVGVLGALTRGTQYSGLADLAAPVAMVALSSFSREHEHEADLIGVKVMSRAGFQPKAMASFLSKMQAKSGLDAKLAGASGSGKFNLFATHPRTPERVNRTIAAANTRPVRQPIIGRDVYLGKLDGLLYGDDPEQGFVRGRQFIHPGLDLRFEVPEGFHLLNGQQRVTATGPDGTLIRFDSVQGKNAPPADAYIARYWAKGQKIANLERLNVNGNEAATATLRMASKQQPVDLRLVAIKTTPERFYRFLLVTKPSQTAAMSDGFRQAVFSFRGLTNEERQQAKPYRLKLVRVAPGDSVSGLAGRLPYRRLQLDRFRVLNGLEENAILRSGQTLKFIVEQ